MEVQEDLLLTVEVVEVVEQMVQELHTQDLEEMVNQIQFQEQLWYTLVVVEVVKEHQVVHQELVELVVVELDV
tara:strand:+ start:529 stop:747 length:219 start_codon:yes stop_codon:yes gene_type:complete